MIMQSVSTFCRLAPGYPDSESGFNVYTKLQQTRDPIFDSTAKKD